MIKVIIILLGLFVTTAQAQEEEQSTAKTFPTIISCLSSKEIFTDLTKRYKEEPIALGKGIVRSAQSGQFYEGQMILWKGSENNSWTLTFTPNDGTDGSTTCLVISGSEFKELTVPGIKT